MRRSDSRIGNPKHGMYYTRAYKSYHAMRTRCLNKNFHAYHRYGGRGIEICERWLRSFENFVNDMGQPPIGYTLERIDNDGSYCPENCRWASRREQAANMLRDRKLTLSDVAEIKRLVSAADETHKSIGRRFGVSASLVCRIAKGQAWTSQ